MKLGFSTLALFMKDFSDIIEIASYNDFSMIEILCEGPYNSGNILKNKKALIDSDLEICIHGPTVDLNIASLNSRIREVSKELYFETIDLASNINATTITLHPGKIGRNDDRLRKYALDLSIESIREIVEYGEKNNVKISVENMPKRFSFLGNSVFELKRIQDETGCFVTIDIGHSNTTVNTNEFLAMDKISYCHLNDNNGEKDSHLPLGEGTIDLNILKNIDKGIIELNNFDNVLKSKEVILKVLE